MGVMLPGSAQNVFLRIQRRIGREDQIRLPGDYLFTDQATEFILLNKALDKRIFIKSRAGIKWLDGEIWKISISLCHLTARGIVVTGVNVQDIKPQASQLTAELN